MIEFISDNGLSFAALVVSIIAVYLNHKTNKRNEQLADQNKLLETAGRFVLIMDGKKHTSPIVFKAVYGNETTMFYLEKIVVGKNSYSMKKVFRKFRKRATATACLKDIDGEYVEGKIGDDVAYSGILDGVEVTFNTFVLGDEHEPMF